MVLVDILSPKIIIHKHDSGQKHFASNHKYE